MSGSQQHLAWRAALVARYPGLFDVPIGGRVLAPGSPTCGDGWRDLVERTVRRIADAASGAPSGSMLSIVQIKEKFGTARFYWSGTGLDDATMAAVEEAVALGEARSACTCETCGEPGRLHDWKGWLLTACPDHARGDVVPREPGWEGITIVRGYKDGRVWLHSCRRYDRDKDSFTDVDPATLGIEE
jgi:hypothetical protein